MRMLPIIASIAMLSEQAVAIAEPATVTFRMRSANGRALEVQYIASTNVFYDNNGRHSTEVVDERCSTPCAITLPTGEQTLVVTDKATQATSRLIRTDLGVDATLDIDFVSHAANRERRYRYTTWGGIAGLVIGGGISGLALGEYRGDSVEQTLKGAGLLTVLVGIVGAVIGASASPGPLSDSTVVHIRPSTDSP